VTVIGVAEVTYQAQAFSNKYYNFTS